MSEGDLDKSEEPTPHRLEESRKRAEVAKSTELNGVFVMIGFALAFALTAGWIGSAVADATRDMLKLAGGGPVLSSELTAWLGGTLGPLGQALMPVLFTVLVMAVVINLVQTGPIFSSHPIKPDFKRLNPTQAIKRIFSLRTVFEFGKLVIKLTLLVALCWWMFDRLGGFAQSVAFSAPASLGKTALRVFVGTSLAVLAILLLVALADLMFVRREYIRKLRMSKREVKDEHKKRDGDPTVRAKQKQLLRELYKKLKASARVGEADVVITNPTHYAVAIRYRPRQMRAPVVLAKGAGMLAARIRQEAARCGVPQTRMPALARALFRECEIDQPVPELLYRELAPVYRWLLSRPGQRVMS